MYKEQKLKANHNFRIDSNKLLPLLSNVQRTKVESKSQHKDGNDVAPPCCYQMYKEQKLKANHNTGVVLRTNIRVVIKCTKNKS